MRRAGRALAPALQRVAYTLPFALAAFAACRRAEPERAEPSAPAGGAAGLLLAGPAGESYEWDSGWPELPPGKQLGYTHGAVAIDSAGRVYVNTDGEDAVLVFDPSGALVDAWGAELAGGLHGMTLAQEDGGEFLYLTHIRQGAVYKTTLAGEIVWRLGWPEESGLYEKPEQYHPTSVAVAPTGDVYVADGYGRSWIHRYDRTPRYLGSFGGPGREKGQLRNPHGLWIDLAGERPLVFVADRENGRLQIFDLAGQVLRVLDRGMGRPCFVETRGERMLVADISGRVAILDRAGALLAELGRNEDPAASDRNDVPKAEQRAGRFISPHCARWDAEGNIYVVDWLLEGRITKLVRRGA